MSGQTATILGAGESLHHRVNKYIDFSTGHITWKDQLLLEEDAQASESEGVSTAPNCDHGLIVHQYREGYWIYCFTGDSASFTFDELAGRCRAGGYSDHLIRLLKIAGNAGCTFLRLDADGTRYTTLPQFDWATEEKSGKPVRTN